MLTVVQVDLQKFRALCDERDRLAKQVDELQADNTRLVEANRALKRRYWGGLDPEFTR